MQIQGMSWFSSFNLPEWMMPAGIICAFIIFGFIADKVVRKSLEKIAQRTKSEIDDIIVKAFKGVIFVWFLLAGFWIALHFISLKQSVSDMINKLLVVIAILSVVVAVSRFATAVISLYSSRARDVLPSTSIFENLTRIIIYVIGFLIILQTLGIAITPILGALGVGGLAVALALQDTLSNLFAGLHIILTRQIRPGDYVKLSTGEEGHVLDVSWRNTTIRNPFNNMVIIPNSKLASAIVTNYNLPEKELILQIQVGVSYDSDLEKVEKVTLEVAREVMKEVDGGVPDFEPVIRYQALGDFSINFIVVLRVKEFSQQGFVKHEFIKRLYKRYREEGISIPFPTHTVHLLSLPSS